jgi:hypothetical protein
VTVTIFLALASIAGFGAVERKKVTVTILLASVGDGRGIGD